MDFTRQSPRAADIHSRYLMASDDYTCIDCHKGIAHELPDMRGIDPGWLPPEEVREELGIQSARPRSSASHRFGGLRDRASAGEVAAQPLLSL
jgi:hypothetical protein